MIASPVVVIGGGPAGACAAFHLARAGIDVIVVEAKAFPRIKVCGEYITPAATGLLEELLPPSQLLAAGARRLSELVIECGEHRHVWHTPHEAWALSRATLDTMLLDKARRAGARLNQPMSVRTVAYTDDAATVHLADGNSIRASLVIHADGSGRHDPHGRVGVAPNLLGFKCHLRPPAGVQGVTMRACAGAYVGTITVEQGLATCALAASRKLATAFRNDIDGLLSHLWPSFRPSWRCSDWLACGVARSGYIGPGHARSIRIGNAAAAVDPVGGEGIGLALWSGRLASRLLAAAPALESPALTRCESQLASAYRRRLRTRRFACRWAAETLMRPRLVRPLWPLLKAPSLCVGPWYRLSGKPA